ncbi:MAG: CPBP family intramembrane metalloprotease [Holophagales bacterium]|nr:CPBP family intramembrane metalloprotease [Holophagales bacterium]
MNGPRSSDPVTPDAPDAVEADPGPVDPEQFYRSAWLAYLVLAILGVLWVGLHFERIPLELFLDVEIWWQDLLWGLASGALLLAAWSAGAYLIRDMRRLEEEIRRRIGPLRDSDAVSLAIISGFSEELFFRGAMQASWGWGWALVIFTVLHTGPGKAFRYWTVFALLAGSLFTWLTLERGNLLPAITAHVLVNCVSLSRLSRMELAASGPGASEQDGSRDGLESSRENGVENGGGSHRELRSRARVSC